MAYNDVFVAKLTDLLGKMETVLSYSDKGVEDDIFKQLKKDLNSLIKENIDSKSTIYELFTKNDVNFKCNELTLELQKNLLDNINLKPELFTAF